MGKCVYRDFSWLVDLVQVEGSVQRKVNIGSKSGYGCIRGLSEVNYFGGGFIQFIWVFESRCLFNLWVNL